MKTKFKILIACTFTTAILLLCFFAIQQYSKKNHEHNLKSYHQNQTEILHAIISFKSEFLEKITLDYACFDELIDFLKTRDTTWAVSNITICKSYNLQTVYIYNLDRQLIYRDKDNSFNTKLIFPACVFDSLKTKKQYGFFINTPEGLLEISASTIHTSADIDRVLEPHGYIFVGKIWNSFVLKTISQFTHGIVSFQKPLNSFGVIDEKAIVTYPIKDFNNKTISTIYSFKEDTSVHYINRLSLFIYLFFGIASILILIILFFSFNKYVIRPLHNITLTLEKEDIGYIESMSKKSNEFSAIAKLIIDFFEQKKQLVSLNNTKDKFFSIIAHDLRGPLIGLHGLTSLLHKNVNKYDKEKIEQISLTLFKASENVYSLMENLLHWAQTQIDNLEFTPKKIQLNEIVKKSILDVESMSLNKEIVIQNKITENIEVVADENLLNFIIRNLLGNAIKFTPKTGTISIEALAMSESIEISVKDNGIGMAKKQLDSLFKIDSVSSALGTEGEKGTGLGLILCKEFVEMHGGLIYAMSEPGKGSTFIFTIPKKKLS